MACTAITKKTDHLTPLRNVGDFRGKYIVAKNDKYNIQSRI